MFKKIWNRILQFIDSPPRYTQTHFINEQLRLISRISAANTLLDLIAVRNKIKTFQVALIESGNEAWGRPLVIELTKYWTIRYKSWKRKSGGY